MQPQIPAAAAADVRAGLKTRRAYRPRAIRVRAWSKCGGGEKRSGKGGGGEGCARRGGGADEGGLHDPPPPTPH